MSFVIEYANGVTLRDKLPRKLRRAIRNNTYPSLLLGLGFLIVVAFAAAIGFAVAGAISGPDSWPYTVAGSALVVVVAAVVTIAWIQDREERIKEVRQKILDGVYREVIITTNDYSGWLFLKDEVWKRTKDLNNNLFIREFLLKPQIIDADRMIRDGADDVQSALWAAEARKLICDKVEAQLKFQLPNAVHDFTGERRFINTDLQEVVDAEASAIKKARAFLTDTKV